jgi:hypothetical protein
MRLTTIIAAILSLAGCTKKPVSTEELRAALRQLVSSSAETELFIAKLQQEAISSSFATTHASYLVEEATRVGEGLANETPRPEIAARFNECRRYQELLRTNLQQLAANLDNSQAVFAIEQRIEEIRMNASEERARL